MILIETFPYSLQSLQFFPSLAGIYERLLCSNTLVTVKKVPGQSSLGDTGLSIHFYPI